GPRPGGSRSRARRIMSPACGRRPPPTSQNPRASRVTRKVVCMIRHRLLAAVVSFVLPIVLVPTAKASVSGRAPVVRTDHGFVRGSTVDGVDKFLGIPFAAPPVGDRRFAPPAP